MRRGHEPLRFDTGWDTDDEAFYVELSIYYWADDDAPVIDRVEVTKLEDYNPLGLIVHTRHRRNLSERERKTYDALLYDLVNQKVNDRNESLLADLGEHAAQQGAS